MKNTDHIYHSKMPASTGSSLPALMEKAWVLYRKYERGTRRTPYLRSHKKSYFAGQKIFLNAYFTHLKQKNPRDRIARIKFFSPGLDLIQNTPYPPTSIRRAKGDLLLRFTGISKDGKPFCVQIQQNSRGNHFLMSTFPKKP